MIIHLGTPGRQREAIASASAVRQRSSGTLTEWRMLVLRKPTAHIRFHWYWPGLTYEVRRTARTCEKCQLGKHGKPTTSTGHRRLHADRP